MVHHAQLSQLRGRSSMHKPSEGLISNASVLFWQYSKSTVGNWLSTGECCKGQLTRAHRCDMHANWLRLEVVHSVGTTFCSKQGKIPKISTDIEKNCVISTACLGKWGLDAMFNHLAPRVPGNRLFFLMHHHLEGASDIIKQVLRFVLQNSHLGNLACASVVLQLNGLPSRQKRKMCVADISVAKQKRSTVLGRTLAGGLCCKHHVCQDCTLVAPGRTSPRTAPGTPYHSSDGTPCPDPSPSHPPGYSPAHAPNS